MKKEKLNRECWDQFLMDKYFAFLRTEGNYVQDGHGKRLKAGIKYSFTNTPNRNPKVAPLIWKHLIIKHFLKYNYN